MAEEDSSGPDSAPPEKQDMDEEFQFLLCEGCHQEAECPKLLPCLHNICTKCLQETKPLEHCPVCRAPRSQADGTPIQENLFFENLQAKLSIFQMIKSGKDLVCDNCKKEGTYWCSDCKEFLCISCFETHQRYLKKESHEARAVKDLRADSSKEFLAEFKNISVMFCPNAEHKTQNLSIYCKACQRSMCCICAVLDSQHIGHHCHIREEIQRRQLKLKDISMEIKEKKVCYDKTCSNLRELVNNMNEVKNETQKLIQEKVAEMIRLVHEKGEELLAAVDEKHRHQVEDTQEKLKNVEHVAQRMASCELLVEKMHLYASDQEVMDLYPFIRESLEELRRKQLPAVETQIEVGNFIEVETQLQAFYERVMKEKEAVPAAVKIASHQQPLGKSPAKRKGEQVGNAIQPSIKVIKIESNDGEWKRSAKLVDLERPGTSFGDHPAGNEDSFWKGEDIEVILEPICSSQPCQTNVPNYLNSCPEDESSDSIEYVDSSLQEETRLENSQDDYLRSVFSRPEELFSGKGTLVFFDLKVLRTSLKDCMGLLRGMWSFLASQAARGEETDATISFPFSPPPRVLAGKVIDLVAVGDESSFFSITIQPLSSSREGMKGGLCESGLQNFLCYLQSLQQPILVGYDLWSMDLPVLVETLEAINQEEKFKASIFGFLDALPLIKEKIPDLLSYNMKSLDHIYLGGQLDDSQAFDCAKTVKDLCTVLDINLAVERRPVISYFSLQCYTSLQPLLTKKLLIRSSVQSLALHGICLSTLQFIYQKDPEHGLKRFSKNLNSRQITGAKKIQQLSKVSAYFQALPSATCGTSSAAPKSGIHS